MGQKDKDFDRAQAMDKLTQDDRDKLKLIMKMMAKEKKIFKGLKEADAIPTEPGTSERASNHDRKMALRSAIDILKAELGVETDDALKYVTTHRDELLDGTVDPYNKDEVIDDYGEYLSVNTEYVREEDGKELNPGNPPANFKSPNEEGDEAVGRESASGAFEESKNWRGETLKEQFKRLSK